MAHYKCHIHCQRSHASPPRESGQEPMANRKWGEKLNPYLKTGAEGTRGIAPEWNDLHFLKTNVWNVCGTQLQVSQMPSHLIRPPFGHLGFLLSGFWLWTRMAKPPPWCKRGCQTTQTLIPNCIILPWGRVWTMYLSLTKFVFCYIFLHFSAFVGISWHAFAFFVHYRLTY